MTAVRASPGSGVVEDLPCGLMLSRAELLARGSLPPNFKPATSALAAYSPTLNNNDAPSYNRAQLSFFSSTRLSRIYHRRIERLEKQTPQAAAGGARRATFSGLVVVQGPLSLSYLGRNIFPALGLTSEPSASASHPEQDGCSQVLGYVG